MSGENFLTDGGDGFRDLDPPENNNDEKVIYKDGNNCSYISPDYFIENGIYESNSLKLYQNTIKNSLPWWVR